MLHLRIEGTSCRNCVQAVKSALDRLDGVELHEIQPCRAQMRCDSDDPGIDEIRDAIRDEGFTAVVVTRADEVPS